jgi:hypothetical protein
MKAAIYESIDSLPSELCGLVAEYAATTRYTWNTIDLPASAECRLVSANSTANSTADTKRPFQIAVSLDEVGCRFWLTMVSETTVSNGYGSWSVELTDDVFGWFGVGLTTSAKNWMTAADSFDDAASPTSWILLARIGRLSLLHDGSAVGAIDRPSLSGRLRVRFDADGISGRITVRASTAFDWRHSSIEPECRIAAPFADIRPCVVLRGKASAVFTSGQATTADDDGDDFRTILTFVANRS